MLKVCSISCISVIHSQTNACSMSAQSLSSLSYTHTHTCMPNVRYISIISVIHSHTNACSVSAQFLSSLSYTHTQAHAQCLLNFCHTLNNSRSCFHSAHKKTVKHVYIYTHVYGIQYIVSSHVLFGERSPDLTFSEIALTEVRTTVLNLSASPSSSQS